MSEKIFLEDYSENWKNEFSGEKKVWEVLLEKNCINIFHIGSTAIKGLKAKPIIDILIEVQSLDELDLISMKINKLGYDVKGEYGIQGRRFFQKWEDGIRKMHIHCFESGNSEINKHLRFRDILNSNYKIAKEYENQKIELAKQYENDRAKYSEGKSEFIQNVLNMKEL